MELFYFLTLTLALKVWFALFYLPIVKMAPDSFVNKGLDHDERCACAPDDAVTTQYDTKVFVFAGRTFGSLTRLRTLNPRN